MTPPKRAPDPYPGECASPAEILDLADAYANAALNLFSASGQTRLKMQQAPARLCAIHAIELYLNAFLRLRGETPSHIRARHHQLWDEAFAAALDLRKKTRAHLEWLSTHREYIVARYAPDLLASQSNANRVLATLNEISRKSGAIRAKGQ